MPNAIQLAEATAAASSRLRANGRTIEQSVNFAQIDREIAEMIIATNPTVEGEATAHYLSQMARQYGIKPTRIAHGVPLGGELEFVDRSTLAHAFGGRLEVDI